MTDVPLEEFTYLLHPYNATLISCKGSDGPPNVLAIAWVMPVSVNPPMLVFAIRKERHSYRLLEESKQFVVNVSGWELARQVLYCGRRSGKTVDKFKEAGLTTGAARKVKVPIVKECVAHIECEVSDMIPRGDHVLVIGSVVAAYVREEVFRRTYDLTRFQPLLHLGFDVFATTLPETIEPQLE